MTDSDGYIGAMGRRTRMKTGLPEEAAWREELLFDDELRARAENLSKCGYDAYLLRLLER